MRVAAAVDGGNSKTHVALVTEDGAVRAFVHGPTCSPEHMGVERALDVLGGLLGRAGLEPPADVASLMLAGLDLPEHEDALRAGAQARGWARSVAATNDSFAVLRAGTERGWGVAVVCGAGINCVGVAPDGRHARFPALGAITGDWGGGYDVGLAGLSAAARSADGRGPRSRLERSVPAHFGFASPSELAYAIRGGGIPHSRLGELAPLVLREAATDAVAGEIVDRLRAEVVAFCRAAIERLDLAGEPVEVVLGGGLLQAGDGRLNGDVERDLRAIAPRVVVHTPVSPPIVGAALSALEALGAGGEAMARVRTELEAAVAGNGSNHG
jgi:N-acetylglucosamine kinase-like BadF-type ATPase